MKQKRKDKMLNQTYSYGQSSYSKPSDVWVVGSDKNVNTSNVRFIEGINYKPTLSLLTSIVRAQEDRIVGKASPIFSSISEMKKWFDEYNE